LSKVCYAVDNEHVIKSSLDRGSDLQLDNNETEDDEDDENVIHEQLGDEGDVILMR
jgi:hypothetical protein